MGQFIKSSVIKNLFLDYSKKNIQEKLSAMDSEQIEKLGNFCEQVNNFIKDKAEEDALLNDLKELHRKKWEEGVYYRHGKEY